MARRKAKVGAAQKLTGCSILVVLSLGSKFRSQLQLGNEQTKRLLSSMEVFLKRDPRR